MANYAVQWAMPMASCGVQWAMPMASCVVQWTMPMASCAVQWEMPMAFSTEHATCIFATLNRRWLTKGSPNCADVQFTYSTRAYSTLISCKLLVQELLPVWTGFISFTEFLRRTSETTAAQYSHAVNLVCNNVLQCDLAGLWMWS